MKKDCLVLIFFIFIALMTGSCRNGVDPSEDYREGDFGIYLKETGELVVSDIGIKYYEIPCSNPDIAIIQLNLEGLKLIRSFIKYDNPQFPDKPDHRRLYQKAFTVKIKQREIYSGTFLSLISSLMPRGIIIEDIIFISNSDKLSIRKSYIQEGDFEYNINDKAILDFFRKTNKLKYVE